MLENTERTYTRISDVRHGPGTNAEYSADPFVEPSMMVPNCICRLSHLSTGIALSTFNLPCACLSLNRWCSETKRTLIRPIELISAWYCVSYSAIPRTFTERPSDITSRCKAFALHRLQTETFCERFWERLVTMFLTLHSDDNSSV